MLEIALRLKFADKVFFGQISIRPEMILTVAAVLKVYLSHR